MLTFGQNNALVSAYVDLVNLLPSMAACDKDIIRETLKELRENFPEVNFSFWENYENN